MSSQKNTYELTVRAILLAIILTAILAMSNAYLALKLGILTSASIPAAIISMGILRFFKDSTILENNAVQTAASAGEAVAGGIVYTIPALVIINYWQAFDYLTNFFIAALGGILGVLFSIPLRRILVHDASLRFPEGRAIAEILKTSDEKSGIGYILAGGLTGFVLELCQTGFKIIESSWTIWFFVKRSLLGFGLGFSATMIGAGYLVGHEMAISIFIGAILSRTLLAPVISYFYPAIMTTTSTQQAAQWLWDGHLRYVGIGAMLFAGSWTFIKLIKPLTKNMILSFNNYTELKKSKDLLPREEKDIPSPYVMAGIALTVSVLFLFFQYILPFDSIGIDGRFVPTFVFLTVLYVVIVGFLLSVITAYFSGMVGVSASPGSSIVIAGMLFAAWLLLTLINHYFSTPLTSNQFKAAEAITIIIGSVVTGIAAIANDNSQDLKVGQLVGATPWRQQLMLLLGVLVSALVIPPVMQILFDVYGIAGVMPREGMDISQSLPAPTAALMAAITQAVFTNTLPWNNLLLGASLILCIILLNHFLSIQKIIRLSILGIAIGMYLPMTSTFPLFVGGMISLIVDKRLGRMPQQTDKKSRKQRAILIACGLVAGSALMDVFLAIPFSFFRSATILQISGPGWEMPGLLLALCMTFGLGAWIVRTVCKD